MKGGLCPFTTKLTENPKPQSVKNLRDCNRDLPLFSARSNHKKGKSSVTNLDLIKSQKLPSASFDNHRYLDLKSFTVHVDKPSAKGKVKLPTKRER